ncbi:MAG: single-stranded DNA-binding protein [Muribaculaceae bacterium]|nr:single-stranded DNA-binding protein [Muribaculaceae bacterium]
MSVNKVILLGYVGADPEIRYPEKDKPIAFVSLATNEVPMNGVEKTEWHKLVFFADTASIVERYVKKGTQLYVEGRLSTREYQDRMKITRKRTEIIVTFFEIVGRKPES